MAKRSDDNPNELAILPTKLQDDIGELLEDAGISEHWVNEVLKAVEEAELAKCEADYERQQERLMEDGPGPTLLEQQAAAMRFK